MKTKLNLPKFEGKPLIEIPRFIPQANFLVGDFGKAVYEEAKARALKDYNNAKVLQIAGYDDDIVKGSNPFYAVLVNQIVSQERLRVATPADLEKVLKTNAWPLIGQYEDSALVLRSDGEPNGYLAKNISQQVKSRNPKQKYPVMIPLNGLQLTNDSNSPHGLAFKLTDNAETVYAQILNKGGNFNSEDIDEKTGLPKRLTKGNRTLYSRDSGLSRLYLYTYLGLLAYNDSLANSNSDGRVVVVSEE